MVEMLYNIFRRSNVPVHFVFFKGQQEQGNTDWFWINAFFVYW